MEFDIDPISGFTEKQKHQNFFKILSTTQYLDDGGRITEDWMEEHKRLILMYREWISDYTDVNDEIQETAFRKGCAETETLLRHLCHSISTTGTFNVNVYHLFIRHMKHIIESVYTNEELADMLAGLSM